MHLTKEQLLVMLKKAYSRGVWDHTVQTTNIRTDAPYRMLNIPDRNVEDLIEE